MTTINSLETPCLIVDHDRLVNNLKRMEDVAASRGVALRPHLKTTRSLSIARLAVSNSAPMATVSTLKDAEAFGQEGITDILYSNAIVPQKLPYAAKIRSKGINLKVVLDSVEMATKLCKFVETSGAKISALIELDMDAHRSGVRPEDAEQLIAIGAVLSKQGLLGGVMAHAGKSYALNTPASIERIAREEELAACLAAKTLRNAGYECEIVSVGSTPTALIDIPNEGITEIRAGTYMFFDLVQSGVGICTLDDIAMSVLTTVNGYNPTTKRLVTDSGWMALSRDRGTSKQKNDYFYGQVCHEDGRVIPDIVVLDTQQDHGIIGARPGSDVEVPKLEIGTLLRILPNHACATAAQHECYHVINKNNVVEATWPRLPR